MGTPEFAVPSLLRLIEDDYNIVGVVTTPDKPAGRGLQLHQSAIKIVASSHHLNILQPNDLNDDSFYNDLKDLEVDLMIVIAFRKLPTRIWQLPVLGTFNLHASLLPNYRGAAPINWAVINGESKTGLTTFLIDEKIDTGNILFKEEVSILPDETAGELHDKLMLMAPELVVKTVISISNHSVVPLVQDRVADSQIRKAPKIYRPNCLINWNQSTLPIYNMIRGLSPYPAAFTELISTDGKVFSIKIFKTSMQFSKSNSSIASIDTDGKNYIHVLVTDGLISIEELQLSGRKKMMVKEFLKGFPLNNTFRTPSI